MAYFPNASCPGAARFENECMSCPLGEKACPVATIHLVYNYDQCDHDKFQEALQLLVTDDGECQVKKLVHHGTEGNEE